MSRMLSWLIAVLLLTACGSRTDLGEPGSDANLGLPRYAEDAAFLEQTCGSTCTLLGSDEQGRAIRFQCDGQRCQFFVDGVPGQVCTDLDFANVCSNGVPLCVQRSNFNFARADHAGC